MTRAEHLAWCKTRALKYLPEMPVEALTSMFSDLENHPETRGHIGIGLGLKMMLGGQLDRPEEARRFIEGFN
jgi:hypothetical protein